MKATINGIEIKTKDDVLQAVKINRGEYVEVVYDDVDAKNGSRLTDKGLKWNVLAHHDKETGEEVWDMSRIRYTIKIMLGGVMVDGKLYTIEDCEKMAAEKVIKQIEDDGIEIK